MDDLGKLLPRFLNKHVRGENAPVLEILTPLWPRVAGKAMAEQSRPVAFGNGTLTLAAFSAPWATELRGLHHEILTAINRTLGRPLVKRIRVRQAPGPILTTGIECNCAATPVTPPHPRQQALRSLASRAAAANANEQELIQTGLDPEVREVLLRSFAKYFGRGQRMVN
jgi:hypothetical protein